MRIAYIISAYKLPEQLVRLVRRLNSQNTCFFIHVDKKTDNWIFDRMTEGLRDLSNVHFLPRHACYWGDFGHVRATLKGITEIIRRNLAFDCAISLTGQDYPIKKNDQIQDFLRQNKGKSFMSYFSLPSDEWEDGGLARIEYWHFRLFQKRFAFPANGSRSIKRKIPRGFSPFGGSSYWCLAKECIEYIFQFVRMNPGFVRFFKYVDVPDEIFFQTILMNSSLAGNIINDDLRYIDWKDPNIGGPAVLDKGDFEKMANSPKLFARKFDIHVDPDVLNMIDEKILAGQVLVM